MVSRLSAHPPRTPPELRSLARGAAVVIVAQVSRELVGHALQPVPFGVVTAGT